MHIKHFSAFTQQVPDPLHPGRPARIQRLMPSGAESMSHGGETYTADENGWFDVPHEVGTELCQFRQNGSGFRTPAEVMDQVRLGAMDDADLPSAAETPARKGRRTTKAAEDQD